MQVIMRKRYREKPNFDTDCAIATSGYHSSRGMWIIRIKIDLVGDKSTVTGAMIC
ncbi:hypothetical protein EYZ11_011772 [Aspergillus tanneri]|uniref:Uncharacterized protein n=1 Tax=Aspergillus tanneri TaxID=1220188 RepID=A0A4S3J2I1_9EURO|nr:hypothetical protein EYZ11_011772 [Aspergillus tanneri]